MELFATRLSQFFPSDDILRTRCGATLGTYLGPGALTVALISGEEPGADLEAPAH